MVAESVVCFLPHFFVWWVDNNNFVLLPAHGLSFYPKQAQPSVVCPMYILYIYSLHTAAHALYNIIMSAAALCRRRKLVVGVPYHPGLCLVFLCPTCLEYKHWGTRFRCCRGGKHESEEENGNQRRW